MAFHQPTTRQTLNRSSAAPPGLQVRSSQCDQISSNAGPQLSPSAGGVEESQTWVLFSPADDGATTTSASYLSSVLHDPRTPGRSRASGVASVDTIARSDINSAPFNSDVPSVISGSAAEPDDALQEDDAELDVLDSHLPGFRQVDPAVSHSIPVLPAHDGLGSFRLPQSVTAATPASGANIQMQEHIYAFERYNPRRLKRRRESLDLAQLELEFSPAGPQAAELERNRRIEAWRQEQSLLLLEAIRRETRRRRHSAASAPHHLRRREAGGGPSAAAAAVAAVPAAEEMLAALGGASGVDADYASLIHDMPLAGTEWHEQDDLPGHNAEADEEEEGGVWSRLTRKVIRDLMGIDDRMLAILLGEALPEGIEAEERELAMKLEEGEEDLSSTPKASMMGAGLSAFLRGNSNEESLLSTAQSDDSSSWQLRMLERIARELGLLVHRMSTHHPGAFAAYAGLQQTPLPYAGLPVIPEAESGAMQEEQGRAPSRSNMPSSGDGQRSGDHAVDDYYDGAASGMPSVMIPQFRPTVPPHLQNHAEGRPTQPMAIAGIQREASSGAAAEPATFTQQEWEQDLDIGLVFRYLRSRFTSSSSSNAQSASPLSSSGRPGTHGASSAQEAAARAARVRMHHPLVGRNLPRRASHHHHHHAHPSSLPPSAAAAATSTAPHMTSSATAAAAAAAAAALQSRQRSPSCGAASQSTRSRRSVTRRSGSFSVAASAASRHSSRHYWDIGGSVGTTGSIIASTGAMGSWGEV